MSNIIELKNIILSYDGDRILDNVSLNVEDGQFVTLLGPSGCGKTTLLRIIGGFVAPDEGDVFLDGKKINGVPPHKRPINTVFQRYALFPHLNVFDNVAFGLKIQKIDKKEIKERVLKMLEIVDLKGFERRKVGRLSGGQQQRVAIARALVNNPKILLLDEPLGALDLKLRKDMQIELMQIQQKLKITFIYVTHDQEEALTMSDMVVVMKDGVIQQAGKPEDIYNEPKNAFVADFIGESNIFDAVMLKDYSVSFCGETFECLDAGFGKKTHVDVVLRPEDINLVEAGKAKLTGVVENVVFKGVHYEMSVKCNGLIWLVHSSQMQPVGASVGLDFTADAIHIMKRLFEGDTNILEGEVIAENTVEFLGVSFERENLGLEEGSKVQLAVSPKDIEVVSVDRADMTVYLESLIYKGDYNELVVYTYEGGKSILLHSYLDQQVATDIGIKFNFDKIVITPKVDTEVAEGE